MVGSIGSDSISSPVEFEDEFDDFPPELDDGLEFLGCRTPLSQVNLLPDLIQVNFLPPEKETSFLVLQADPGFTSAIADGEKQNAINEAMPSTDVIFSIWRI